MKRSAKHLPEFCGKSFKVLQQNTCHHYLTMMRMNIFLEPAVLEEKAKQQPGEENAYEIVEVREIVIRADGKEEVIIKNHRQASIEQAERVFKYDIMISYCHADKDLVHQIHRFLSDQGFKIWIDLDNMFGPGNREYFSIKSLETSLLMFSYECYGGGS